jgi:uncharacterized OB-fold protein
MSVAAEDWAGGLRLMAGPYFVGLYQPSPETAFYWEGVRAHELRLRACPDCGRALHPKRIVCTQCGATELTWRKAAGQGEVYSFSEVHRVAAPEFAAAAPYIVGVVRLTEGVSLFTRFIADPGPVRIGAPAQVAFRTLEQGQLLPVFLVGA